MAKRRTLVDIIGRDSYSNLVSINRSLNSDGKRFNKRELEILQKKVMEAACDSRFGSTIITIDGLKSSGKSTLRKRLQTDLEKDGVRTFFFKESNYADSNVIQKWREFRKNFGYGGNPFDSVEYVSDVRLNAMDKSNVLLNFHNKDSVILYERSYIFTLACALASSFTQFNNYRPNMFPFMDVILERMKDTFVIPDLSVILQISYDTMCERVRERESSTEREEEMGLPPKNVGKALYKFGKRGSNGETILPNVYRIATDGPKNAPEELRVEFFNNVYASVKKEVYSKLQERGFMVGDK